MTTEQQPTNLTDPEKAMNSETWAHIHQVQRLLLQCAADLGERCLAHDQSKLVPPEVSTFCEFTPKLKHAEYGSDEYKQFLKDMKPALDHHYANNSHHPEHFEQGVEGMTLLDVLEMFCDWIASGKRTKGGNIYKSLDLQQQRFNMSPQLIAILRNTARVLAPDQVAPDATGATATTPLMMPVGYSIARNRIMYRGQILSVEEIVLDRIAVFAGEGNVESLSADSTFTSFGFDSLDSVEFGIELEEIFNIEIPDSAMTEGKTVADLVSIIDNLISPLIQKE